MELRNRQKRNFLATLFLSQGVPMLVSGDEMGKTQHGNNNAYCQDNGMSWLDWENADTKLLAFTQELIHFVKRHPVFNRRKWFKGRPIKGDEAKDIAWFLPEGSEMTDEHWASHFAKSLGIFLNGRLHIIGDKGERVGDDSFYVLFNAHHEPVIYKLPPEKYGKRWKIVLNTAVGLEALEDGRNANEELTVEGRCVMILQEVSPL
jgi:isoamylase